jgi:MOSC domain-containing protein YiiM
MLSAGCRVCAIPVGQIDDFQDGLMGRLRYRGDDGSVVRIAGVMGVVLAGGEVRPGNSIEPISRSSHTPH